MSLQYRVKIHLGIFSAKLLDGGPSYEIVLSEDENTPRALMYGPHQTVDVLKKISNKHLKIDADWLDIKLIGIINIKTSKGYELNIFHGVIIPSDIDLQCGRWIPINEYLSFDKEFAVKDHSYHYLIKNMSLIIH
jgi:hypothetical protein